MQEIKKNNNYKEEKNWMGQSQNFIFSRTSSKNCYIPQDG